MEKFTLTFEQCFEIKRKVEKYEKRYLSYFGVITVVLLILAIYIMGHFPFSWRQGIIGTLIPVALWIVYIGYFLSINAVYKDMVFNYEHRLILDQLFPGVHIPDKVDGEYFYNGVFDLETSRPIMIDKATTIKKEPSIDKATKDSHDSAVQTALNLFLGTIKKEPSK